MATNLTHVYRYLRLAHENGRLPYRWPETGKFIAPGVYKEAERRGWSEGDDPACFAEITDAGRAALLSVERNTK